MAERQQANRIEPFMMAQPRVDIEALRPPPRAPLSDKDRMAMTRERPPNPTNQQPFSRGNTRQPEEAAPPSTSPPPGAPTPPPQSAGNNGDRESLPREAQTGYVVPDRGAGGTGPPSDSTVASRIPPGTPRALADALGNLSRYVERSGAQLENPNGGGQYGQSFQFDTKGVDFGAWLRAFKAQVMRNWMIPQAAYFLHGHVSLTLIISRTGRDHGAPGDRPVLGRGVHARRLQRARRLQSDRAASAGVSGPDAAHAGDLLLQRGAAGSDAMILPTRAQQRGLLLLLAALTIYVCWTLAR